MWRLSLLFTLLISQAFAIDLPEYRAMTIDSGRVYRLDKFPYIDYLVCIKESDQGEAVAVYLHHDPVFKQQLRSVAGELAGLFYRYLNEQPHKPSVQSNPALEASFPQSEPAPFVPLNTMQNYHFPSSTLTSLKRPYQFQIAAQEIFKQSSANPRLRHWVRLQVKLLRRTSATRVVADQRFPPITLLMSLELQSVQQSLNEQQAYQQAADHVQLYFLPQMAEACLPLSKIKQGIAGS